MRHFLQINQLSLTQIHNLIYRALAFKQHTSYPKFKDYTLANLFYENSTRTRVSFEMAAQKLGINVVNLDLQSSSESKGERIEDTINNLAAMGIQMFIMRHRDDQLIFELSKKIDPSIHLINAGSGQSAHPSQAMLDLMTIYKRKPDLKQLKIAILGDIKHSRVANSLQQLFSIVKIKELTLISPPLWQPEQTSVNFGTVTSSLKEGLLNADVIICLRVQKERLKDNETIDLAQYRLNYTLTQATLQYAKRDVMIMHPGPVNHDVEIESALVTGPKSYILEQVKNGVYMRMAILEILLS